MLLRKTIFHLRISSFSSYVLRSALGKSFVKKKYQIERKIVIKLSMFLCLTIYFFIVLFPTHAIAANKQQHNFYSNSASIDNQFTLQNWWVEKWWIVQNRFNFYVNDIRLIRDKLLLNTIIGDQNQLSMRTHYDIKNIEHDISFLKNQIFFRYFQSHNEMSYDIDNYYIDPFTSYDKTINFYGSDADKIRNFVVDIFQNDLDTEAMIDISAFWISYFNNFKTNWITVQEAIIRGEWSIAFGVSALMYAQNNIDVGLVMPLYRSKTNKRWAAVLNLNDVGIDASPKLETGLIYETQYLAITTLIRHRYGNKELYKFIKETVKLKFEADLFSRSFFGNYFKVKWLNTIERNIGSSNVKYDTEDDKKKFTYVHDYIVRVSMYHAASKSSRDYVVKIRFLDLRINTLSVIIPTFVFEMKGGLYPLIKDSITLKLLAEGGYGFPLNILNEDEKERGQHFMIGLEASW